LQQNQAERVRKLAVAKQRQTEISGKIGRLLQMVVDGLMDNNDPDLATQLQALKAQRAQATQEVELLEQSASNKNKTITEHKLARFGELIRQGMNSDDSTFRKAYLRLFVATINTNVSLIATHGIRSLCWRPPPANPRAYQLS
jgi:hypothetical protein